MSFIRLRDHDHAQHEIRVYANGGEMAKRKITKTELEAAVGAHAGNVLAIARDRGCTPQTIYNALDAYGMRGDLDAARSSALDAAAIALRKSPVGIRRALMALAESTGGITKAELEQLFRRCLGRWRHLMKAKIYERNIQAAVVHRLRWHGWMVREISQRNAVTGDLIGIPDVIAFKSGHTLMIECKRPGGKVRHSQIVFAAEIDDHAAITLTYALFDNSDKFATFLRSHETKAGIVTVNYDLY